MLQHQKVLHHVLLKATLYILYLTCLQQWTGSSSHSAVIFGKVRYIIINEMSRKLFGQIDQRLCQIFPNQSS